MRKQKIGWLLTQTCVLNFGVNYKALSNEELIEKTMRTVRVEHAATAEVIRLFQEIADRKLYTKYGYPGIYEMAIKHFGYCAASAMRRINAMKLVREVPEIEKKIESGELSLSVASEVQSFFYQEARHDRPYSLDAKMELLEQSIGKSKRQVELELASRNPDRDKRESAVPSTHDRARLNFAISKETNEKLAHLRELIDPDISTEDLFTKLIELGLQKFEKRSVIRRPVVKADVLHFR